MITKRNEVLANSLRFIFSVIGLEGLLALVFLFQIQSMERSQWLLGLSAPRLIMATAFGLAMVILWVGVVKAYVNDTWARQISQISVSWLSRNDRLYHLTVSLVVLIIFITLYILAATLLPQVKNSIFGSVYQRTKPIALWLLVTMIQVGVYLVFSFLDVYKQRGYCRVAANLRLVSFGFVIIAAFGQWLILFLDLPVFTAIPHWFWLHFEKGSIHPAYFALLLLFLLFGFSYILWKRANVRGNIFVLIIIGYCIIVGFGFIEGQGFESLRKKHLSANYLEGYSGWAAQGWMNPLLIKEYEERFSGDFLLGTKPPGVLFLYSLTQKISNLVYPETNFEGRQLRLTQFIAIVFPLLSFVVLPVIYLVAKKGLGIADAFIPCILYIATPNVLLMPLGFDQVLYPLLFMVGIYLTISCALKGSFRIALLTGVYLFIACFFSFSLLPLFVWVPLWFVINEWLTIRKFVTKRVVVLILGVAIGFCAALFLFRIILNYDILLRYTHALEQHRQIMEYQPTLDYQKKALFLNNAEFGWWLGFPLVLLLILQSFQSVVNFIRRRTQWLDWFWLTFFVIYLFLNLFGQTRGEVGRLWLFLVPVISILGGYQLSRDPKLKFLATGLIVILQLITTYFLFAYQCPCTY